MFPARTVGIRPGLQEDFLENLMLSDKSESVSIQLHRKLRLCQES